MKLCGNWPHTKPAMTIEAHRGQLSEQAPCYAYFLEIVMDKLRLRDTSDAPWRLHEGGTSVVDKDGRLVASCGFIPNRTVFEERANAKLISLAPDLADALKDLVNTVADKNNGDHSGNVSVSIAVSILKQIEAYDDKYA